MPSATTALCCHPTNDSLLLTSSDRALIEEILRNKHLAPLIQGREGETSLRIDAGNRGRLKQALIGFGYPAEDLAGYVEGAELPMALREWTLGGESFGLRSYQQDAVAVFHAGGGVTGGSGVIVLPCGAGKTMVGMGAIAALQTQTLILTPSTVAARQWIRENATGRKQYKKLLNADPKHPIEKVGAKLRARMPWLEQTR